MKMENFSPFFQELQDWLSGLPVNFRSEFNDFPENHFLIIDSTKGRTLNIFLKKSSDFLENINDELVNHSPDSEAFQVIVIWEDQWHTKQRIVKSRLKALLGISERIPARLTMVRRLDRPTASHFLQENHLQDAVVSKYKYGLYLPKKHFRVLANPTQADELLVAVATFARPRVFERPDGPHRSFELVRFANLLNTTVVGGLNKLLSHFIKSYQPDDLMTYADLEWSSGRSYQKLGFASQGDTPPQEFWVDPTTMERYYPHRLPNGISHENARQQGFVKIKNAGSRKFVKNFHPQTS